MRRLLIVEDNAAVIELLREQLSNAFPRLDIRDSGFKNAVDMLAEFRPDIVILDLAEGIGDTNAATPSWDFVWERHFCPIIIHSAYEAADYMRNHPFSRYERKTKDSAANVVKLIKELVEHIDGIRALREEIENRIANSLREVSPLVWRESLTIPERREMLLRLTRRRIAASLDSSTASTDIIKAIEQFIYPPLEDSLLIGDVLVKRDANMNSAESYRVILTPSCDMVTGSGRAPVENILLAQCVIVSDPEILRRLSLLETKPAELPAILGRRLKEDLRSDQIVFPAINGCWPAMVVDLKRIEIIRSEKIGLNQKDRPEETLFFRLASLDSPFREKIAWRYVETMGRPGLPFIDKTALEKDVVAAANPKEK
ncbi:MAG TPA: hypothetical protein VGY56_02575 [Verrucomicrobiae bacterium]|nr:hypothetical protein [Verrucomicrobiae bacterium]